MTAMSSRVIRLPEIEVSGIAARHRRFRDPMLTRQIGRLCPSFVLAQNPNDLLFREPATLHRPSLQQGRTLILRGGKTQWQVNGRSEKVADWR